MPVAVNDVVRVAAKLIYDGSDEFINVFHVANTGVGAVANSVFLSAMSAELDSLYTNIDFILTSLLDASTLVAYNVTQDAPIGETGWGGSVPFTNSGEPLPAQVAGLISLATGVKKVIGKKYIPGLTITDVADGNVLETVAINALAAFGAQMLTSFDVGGEDFDYGVLRSVGGAFRAFSSAVARYGVFTQRRRRPGEGG